MNLYEIKYSHKDMPDGYISCTTKWGRDKEHAVGFICKGRPDKDGRCQTKRNASLIILSVDEISNK